MRLSGGSYSLFSVTKKGDKKVKNVPFYRGVQAVVEGAGRSPLRFSLAELAKIRGTTAPEVLGESRGFLFRLALWESCQRKLTERV